MDVELCGGNLADSHCHILDPRLADRAEQIVACMKDDGLDFIVEISASAEESTEALKLANTHEDVYCTIGVHPHNSNDYNDEFERWAGAQNLNKVVALGEVGLDYHFPDSPSKEMQAHVFMRQIFLADKLKLPLVVHTRDAFEDTLQILIENKKHIRNGLLLHCFSEGAQQVAQILEHFDAYFAFGGAITYKGNKSDEAIRAVPIDRILLETDAPYLSPVPLRGKINEPKNVRLVAQYISSLLNLPFSDIAQITLDNTKRFYKIQQK